jgi:hypothetical protein
MNHTVPDEMKKHQRNLKVKYGSAYADIVIGDNSGMKILSVIYIQNNKEGNGHASKIIDYLEEYAIQCRCKEIWFPTVLNLRLAGMLMRRDYKLVKMRDDLFGEVDVFTKRLNEK